MALAMPLSAVPDVSEAEFNALKETVRRLAEDMQKLQQTHVIDAQAHESDVKQIQELREKCISTIQKCISVEQHAEQAENAASQLRQIEFSKEECRKWWKFW